MVRSWLQAASRAYYANKWILNDRSVPVWSRLQFFAAVVSPVACFGGCDRTTNKDDMNKLDVVFRRLARQLVGPPSGMDWRQPWHETLHLWHDRLSGFLDDSNVRCWSETVLRQYWFFAAYVASLPPDRWVKRALQWHPVGTTSQGRPRKAWPDDLVAVCSQHQLGDWMDVARDAGAWGALVDDFVGFASQR